MKDPGCDCSGVFVPQAGRGRIAGVCLKRRVNAAAGGWFLGMELSSRSSRLQRDAQNRALAGGKTMRQLTTLVAALALVSFVGVNAVPAAPAATGDTYKAKKAECKKRADGMSFGVHLIKKNRWVK